MDDLISREEAIKAIKKDIASTHSMEIAIKAIKKVPTAQPKIDDILSYIDRISNSGMGKKKALEYLRKYVEKSAE